MIRAILSMIITFLFLDNISAQNTITFQVDVTHEESAKEVGIRGGFAPLSWNENLLMQDIDGNGVYKITIEFPDSLTGKTLEYKFLKDNIWERQDVNNRKLFLTGKKQILPANTWKIHSDAYLFNKMSRSYFGKFVFIFHSGKKQGKTPKEIVWEMIEYYSWRPSDWPSKPSDIMDRIKSGQEGHKGSFFEILVDKPNRVKFIMGRYWREWFDLYGAGLGIDEKGVIQGVSKEDLETYYSTWIEYYCNKNDKNWELSIEDDGESKWIVTITNPQ
ncbi:hypothetical protein H7U19_13210 [Hyunsoonleella sp. SJ7]|uniref:CBM20 domain-containing protein n=1 Tax=Hyunsoonleella aquatilis TaxID=2762758 RepID=A0A923HDW0_9FLAO|nr:hypothetical protein [Hyunsoonleella aquatilis]MBC3759371.1 hypothetical protein [Hyunsoonleella aquatilis]